MSGTVCDTTRYGSTPRCTVLKRAMSTASPTPTAPPKTNPAALRRNEYHTPASTDSNTVRSEPRTSGRLKRENISHTCGIAYSLVRGKMRTPAMVPPSCGPTALYDSHTTTTSANATTNIAVRRAARTTSAVIAWRGLAARWRA